MIRFLQLGSLRTKTFLPFGSTEASLGEIVPAAHSANTAAEALAASAADLILTGNSKATRRSRFVPPIVPNTIALQLCLLPVPARSLYEQARPLHRPGVPPLGSSPGYAIP